MVQIKLYLLHSERSKLHAILAFLSAIRLKKKTMKNCTYFETRQQFRRLFSSRYINICVLISIGNSRIKSLYKRFGKMSER